MKLWKIDQGEMIQDGQRIASVRGDYVEGETIEDAVECCRRHSLDVTALSRTFDCVYMQDGRVAGNPPGTKA